MSLRLEKTAIAAAIALGCGGSGARASRLRARSRWTEFNDYSGTLTKFELVNPHSYLYFETVGADGKPLAMRCEMRAATLIKRSGWKTDEFVAGPARRHPRPPAPRRPALVLPREHRDRRHDRRSTATISSRTRPSTLRSGRCACRRASRTSRATGPSSRPCSRFRRAAATARSCRAACARTSRPARSRSSRFARAIPRPRGRATPRAGQEAATAFRMWSPRTIRGLSCKPTSIVFDWTFDWPVNRITQTTVDGEKVIDIDYGLFSATRRDPRRYGRAIRRTLQPSNSRPLDRPLGRRHARRRHGRLRDGVLVPPTRNSPTSCTSSSASRSTRRRSR